MSSAPSHTDRPLLADAQTLQSLAVRPVRTIGFWAAVVLPFVLLVLLVTGVGLRYPTALAGILGLNVAGLVAGRGHNID